jgi:hypothetical protein
MKRRKLGLLVGSSLAYAAVLRSAEAQTVAAPADPALLTTTLTPLGAERAGNADGSIPAWTGGMVAAPGSPAAIRVFEDEQPLVTVDASNMAEHADLLSDGVQEMITKFGYSIKVYPTHRTAAAQQYVYDNAAKNVTRSQFSSKGGRFGFTGAYGGPPFPIIDTANPDVGGPQLIWNHLTAWAGFCATRFSPGFVVSDDKIVLSEGGKDSFRYPYYDPEGSPETFGGYLTKTLVEFQAPPNFNGQMFLSWHTANTEEHPDITWSLLNGQGRVRKAPNEQYDTPSGYFNGLSNADENSGFYGNPSQYDWKYITKKEMYIPYHNNNLQFATPAEWLLAKYPSPDIARWEKHRVWVVEANLHPGMYNVMARRRFYIDEDSWNIAVGESYNGDGNMSNVYLQFLRVVPSIPCVGPTGFVNFHVQQDAYLYAGLIKVPGLDFPEDNSVVPESVFDPQLVAAKASF